MSLHGVSVVYHFFFSTVYLPCQWGRRLPGVVMFESAVCVYVAATLKEALTNCFERCENWGTERRNRVRSASLTDLQARQLANARCVHVCCCRSQGECCWWSSSWWRRTRRFRFWVTLSLSSSAPLPVLSFSKTSCALLAVLLPLTSPSRTLWSSSGSGAALSDAHSVTVCLPDYHHTVYFACGFQ